MEIDPKTLTPHVYQGITVLVDKYAQPWMSQKQIAQLLGINVSSVNEILGVAIKNDEIKSESTIRVSRIVENGKTYSIKHYDLKCILLVGFRAKATTKVLAFRDWVADVVLAHLISNLETENATLKENLALQESHVQDYRNMLRVYRKQADYYQRYVKRLEEAYTKERLENISLNAELDEFWEQKYSDEPKTDGEA